MKVFSKSVWAAMLVVLGACHAMPSIPVRLLSGRQLGDEPRDFDPDELAMIDDASALLGLEIDLTERTFGAVEIELLDVAPGERAFGRNYRNGFCFDSRRASRFAPHVAHEIAHALGLEHTSDVDDPDGTAENLMSRCIDPHSDPADYVLNDDQFHELVVAARSRGFFCL